MKKFCIYRDTFELTVKHNETTILTNENVFGLKIKDAIDSGRSAFNFGPVFESENYTTALEKFDELTKNERKNISVPGTHVFNCYKLISIDTGKHSVQYYKEFAPSVVYICFCFSGDRFSISGKAPYADYDYVQLASDMTQEETERQLTDYLVNDISNREEMDYIIYNDNGDLVFRTNWVYGCVNTFEY